ncbi:monovalent cation/H(+) antiporter subunit G [Oceanirhabdus seepicola]|uniref:Monovalent cation/H(+) antiporter subunit G n=1 Tax=Oceanirhabdus seepicola TaxID=2828781 RepID=A0A9J6P704_9CLOT|nr:monovalent cation/H(+) antiporter subunit G [Oceanirhabdus seepicola]
MIYKLLFILSWIYIIFGIIGIFSFNDIYSRLLTSSKIDTAALLTIFFALIIKCGFSTMSIKLFLILLFIIITGPVANHIIARSAYLNGIESMKEGKK